MSDVSDWKNRLSRVIRANAQEMADRYEEFEEQGGFQSIGEKVKRGFREFAGYVREGYRDATGSWEGDRLGRDGTTEGHREKSSGTPKSEGDKTLRDYYANLEVEYGADMKTVKKSYRRLMRRYHPDNFSDDPEMEKLATELTQELSQAYEKIRQHKGK